MAHFSANDLNVMQAAFDRAIASLTCTGPIDDKVRDRVALAVASMAKTGHREAFELQVFAMREGLSLHQPHALAAA